MRIMPYMKSACVQFSHEQNIYDSAGAVFIDCLSTAALCDTGDSSVSIVMRPPLLTPYCMERYLAKVTLLKLLLPISCRMSETVTGRATVTIDR